MAHRGGGDARAPAQKLPQSVSRQNDAQRFQGPAVLFGYGPAAYFSKAHLQSPGALHLGAQIVMAPVIDLNFSEMVHGCGPGWGKDYKPCLLSKSGENHLSAASFRVILNTSRFVKFSRVHELARLKRNKKWY